MGAAWFVRPDPRPLAQLRLFCFPHAGGGASSYVPWAPLLPPEIDLCIAQAPGRESRLREQSIHDFGQLLEAFAGRIEEHLDLPFAFFGHSMGACVAFELARQVTRTNHPGLVHLFVAGRRAPRLPERYPPLHVLTDEEFVGEIRRRFGGIPDEVMRHPDLMALLLPGLRADIGAMERHRFIGGIPLTCGITALGGISDPTATAQELGDWTAETVGMFGLRLFAGGHFFVQSARGSVVNALVEVLRSGMRSHQMEAGAA